jgi:hypothetical protein
MILTLGRRSGRRREWYFDGKDSDEIDAVCSVKPVLVVERTFEWKRSRVESASAMAAAAALIVSLLRAE